MPPPALDPRTRALLDGPVLPTLLRLAAPNMLVMLVQAGAGLYEVWLIGHLGTAALAGMALVFPVVMLMQMMSAGAMGGGISSAIARALGGGRRDDANALTVHALAIATAFGLAFSVILLAGGTALYSAMGGSGATLLAALDYSDLVFAGAVLVWWSNSLVAIVRGTGNMAVPSKVFVSGAVGLVLLSPVLVFGWGPVPALGVRGGAAALLAYYGFGVLAMAWYVWSPRCVVRTTLGPAGWRWPLFRDILRVGLLAAVATLATNLAVAITTGLVGRFGAAEIAGYGTGVRLEYLMVPLVFGLGGPLVAMVGTAIGAGRRERALRVTWAGAAMAGGLTECMGLVAAAFPLAWLGLFDHDPSMLAAGSLYLRIVGPFYGFFGLGLALYFASQGAGHLRWPLMGNLARLVIVLLAGGAVVAAGGGLLGLFVVQVVGLIAYGLLNAWAVAGGAWFGPLGRPVTIARLIQRVERERPAPQAGTV